MEELVAGWEIVRRKTNAQLWHYFFAVLQGMSGLGPENRSSVTFTVKNRETGEIRKVTGKSLEEAQARLLAGQFD